MALDLDTEPPEAQVLSPGSPFFWAPGLPTERSGNTGNAKQHPIKNLRFIVTRKREE
jgi:hypothetical protein